MWTFETNLWLICLNWGIYPTKLNQGLNLASICSQVLVFNKHEYKHKHVLHETWTLVGYLTTSFFPIDLLMRYSFFLFFFYLWNTHLWATPLLNFKVIPKKIYTILGLLYDIWGTWCMFHPWMVWDGLAWDIILDGFA
jgi:hypothetical protein